MHRVSKTNVLHAWIALLAFLFGLLAPVVSHAIPRSPVQAHLSEICTSSGIRIDGSGLTGGQGQPSDVVLHGFKHCDFCGTHPASFTLLPQPMLVLAVLDGHDFFPSLFYQSPTPLFAWTRAKSRAPPAPTI